jgi:hypothetical protein
MDAIAPPATEAIFTALRRENRGVSECCWLPDMLISCEDWCLKKMV